MDETICLFRKSNAEYVLALLKTQTIFIAIISSNFHSKNHFNLNPFSIKKKFPEKLQKIYFLGKILKFWLPFDSRLFVRPLPIKSPALNSKRNVLIPACFHKSRIDSCPSCFTCYELRGWFKLLQNYSTPTKNVSNTSKSLVNYQ